MIPDHCRTRQTNTLMYRTNAVYSQMPRPECTALNNVEFGCISGWPRFSMNEKLEDSCAVLLQEPAVFACWQHEQHVEDMLMRRMQSMVKLRISMTLWSVRESSPYKRGREWRSIERGHFISHSWPGCRGNTEIPSMTEGPLPRQRLWMRGAW